MRWTYVNIPTDLARRARDIIEERKELGYNSLSSFVTDAVRRRVEELER